MTDKWQRQRSSFYRYSIR